MLSDMLNEQLRKWEGSELRKHTYHAKSTPYYQGASQSHKGPKNF